MNDAFKSQLTALALDELSGEERLAVEAQLTRTPEAQAYAAETNAFCALLAESLAAPEDAALTEEQRIGLTRQLAEPMVVTGGADSSRTRGVWASWALGLGAAAAAVLVANHLWRDHEIDGVALRAAGSLDTSMVGGGLAGNRGGAEALTENGPGGRMRAGADQPHSAAEVGQLLNEGLGYYDLGDYDRARDSFNRVLVQDPHNTAARRQLERIEKSVNDPLLVSRDETRAKMVREVDESWESAPSSSLAARGAIAPGVTDATPLDRLTEASSGTESLMRTTDQPVAADMLASSEQSLDKKLADTAPFGDDSRLAANAPAAPVSPEAAAQPANALSLNDSVDAYQFSGTAETKTEREAAPLSGLVDSGLRAQGPVAAGKPVELAQLAESADHALRRHPGGGGVTPGLEPSAAPADGTLAGGLPGSAGGAEIRMRGSLELPKSTRDASGVTMEFREGAEPRLVEKPASKENQIGFGRRESEARFLVPAPADPFFATLDAEAYQDVPENPFLAVAGAPLSTFSIDVDTAGYANVRRFLNQGQRPPKAAVRLEEMVNYFRYDYPQPAGEVPFSVTVDLADCPWQPHHRLARVGLQGKAVPREQRPAANLVFLVDVSGSMDQPNKLPLVKQSLHLLTSQLKGSDHVAIVTYAGNSGVALPSTSLEQKEAVTRAVDALSAGGSTNGASGLQLAYQQARQHFKAGGVNRVILATDGDFNVGLTSRDELHTLITSEAKGGVFLSVLGYGMGNLKDATMEMLADTGNGNYAYIDSLSEARKVLADQLEGTLMTIAKDVKVQIEFNPAQVRQYRLLGYENRLLAKEDFNDDRKDAGEIGAGHSVTALYEIVPHSAPAPQPPVDPLKYQPAPAVAAAPVAVDQPASRESMTVKLRYKAPDGEASRLLEVPVVDENRKFAEAPADFKFAAGVAMTGLLLKDSAHKGAANWNLVRELARAGKGPDAEGYRGEFLQLIEKAAGVAP